MHPLTPTGRATAVTLSPPPPPPARARALVRPAAAPLPAPHTPRLHSRDPTFTAAASMADDGDGAPPGLDPSMTSAALLAATGGARVAAVGDTVSVHFALKDEDGAVLDSSQARGEPITFEVGAGDVFANDLYQAFDAVVRGLAVGESTSLEAVGGEWDPGLLFTVPFSHPEVERLAGRYKSVGGLAEGLVVELANGARAVITKLVEGESVCLDANDMLAGRKRVFELTLVGIEN